MRLFRKDLLGLEELKTEEIELILTTAESFKEISERAVKKVPILRGKTIVNLFFEPSTRTSASFDLAAKRLSADTVNISAKTSSVVKGETLLDTAKNLEAMKIDLIVIRHSSAGAPHFLAKRLKAGVINAGDGSHEHPTQGLLDLMTIKEKFGRIERLRVLIVGDIAHSRVARSNIWGLKKFKVEVSVCSPPTLIPLEVEKLGVKVFYNLDEAVEEQDVINVLRLQLERQTKGLFPSIREYTKLYGINLERLKKAKREVVIMHPGPINRGVELDPEVADGPYSVILDQVTNGVAVRMAVLYLLSGGEATQ
ncbi:MAG: aspartate carbamoyltransferase catalytic subunit [Candidatus Edwardsbacteria bacterium]